MNETGTTLESLMRRALRLIDRVERAVQNHPDRAIRAGGARLSELMEEWIDELRILDEDRDEAYEDRARAFARRLRLAESKVDTWPTPGSRRKAA